MNGVSKQRAASRVPAMLIAAVLIQPVVSFAQQSSAGQPVQGSSNGRVVATISTLEGTVHLAGVDV